MPNFRRWICLNRSIGIGSLERGMIVIWHWLQCFTTTRG